jgi:hypothetical protein
MADEWYMGRAEGSKGPLSFPDLIEELRSSPDWTQEFVWREGLDAWTQAGLLDEFGAPNRQSGAANPQQTEQTARASRSERGARSERTEPAYAEEAEPMAADAIAPVYGDQPDPSELDRFLMIAVGLMGLGILTGVIAKLLGLA